MILRYISSTMYFNWTDSLLLRSSILPPVHTHTHTYTCRLVAPH